MHEKVRRVEVELEADLQTTDALSLRLQSQDAVLALVQLRLDPCEATYNKGRTTVAYMYM